jgi:sugar transferase (PEP-CTERM system associated)
MPRVSGHYVPARVVALAMTEGAIGFGSVFLGLGLPLIGFHAIRPAWDDAFAPAVVLGALIPAVAHIAALYDTRQVLGRYELLLRLTTAFVAAYLLMAMLGYFLPGLMLARKAFLLSFVTALPASFLLRLIHRRLTLQSVVRRTVLVLGSGPVSQMIAEVVKASGHTHELLGRLDTATAVVSDRDDGVWSLGTMEDLDWVSKLTRPDVIVVALEERRGLLPVTEIVESKLRGTEVQDWPDFYEKLTGKIPVGNLRPSWLVFSEGFKPGRLTMLAKRTMDVLLCLSMLVLALPVILMIAVAIKLDSAGPVLFRQERIGRFGRVFKILKFRSMHADAALKPSPPTDGPDSRVTSVGRFLRRTRLDELPQLFNVILGDMSLVGPRPEWVALVPEFTAKVPLYLHRLAVKPGITGWAQVKNSYGASVSNTWEKLQYDLYYIKNLSIFLDMLILLHTVHIVLFTRGSGRWKNQQEAPSTTSVSYVG